jgi:pyrroline-5-carboxylate reductase
MILGVIGVGNMGGAIVRGYCDAGGTVVCFDMDSEKLTSVCAQTGARAAVDLGDLALSATHIVLAVKPGAFESLLPSLRGFDEPVYISIAAGISTSYMRSLLGDTAKVVRVMPNTPAMVGEGMAAVCGGEGVSAETLDEVCSVFGMLGKAVVVSESEMDAVTGISGSSPAYAYMYIQALAQAGEKMGLSADAARLLAAQSTLGAAKMVLENPDVSPEQLRVNVCSPGGTTIEAVGSLMTDNFIEIIEKAAKAAADKSKLMTK